MADFVTKADDKREPQAGGMVRSPEGDKQNPLLIRRGPLFKRWIALLSRGAAVYGEDNWMLALKSTDKAERELTKRRFQKSAARHFEQWLAGERDEDHAAAVIFNMNGYEAMLETDGIVAFAVGMIVDSERGPTAFPCSKEEPCPTCLESQRKTLREAAKEDQAMLDAEIEEGFKQSDYDPDSDGGRYSFGGTK